MKIRSKNLCENNLVETLKSCLPIIYITPKFFRNLYYNDARNSLQVSQYVTLTLHFSEYNF